MFRELFTPMSSDVDIPHNVEHCIETKGPRLFSKARRLNPEKLKFLKQEFQTLMEQEEAFIYPVVISFLFKNVLKILIESDIDSFIRLWYYNHGAHISAGSCFNNWISRCSSLPNSLTPIPSVVCMNVPYGVEQLNHINLCTTPHPSAALRQERKFCSS
ncbi:hypothetical protein AVEN_19231-1 [Araneus ventricosus]|uniref:Uncharacterized protein n=1 Tax=Araneus ventricosus TaxID=182803 RepID=A0A4Y2SUT5_ARAVE|nr:hypothetical protein AVEN_19231-1 [Araneus ventricosus]